MGRERGPIWGEWVIKLRCLKLKENKSMSIIVLFTSFVDFNELYTILNCFSDFIFGICCFVLFLLESYRFCVGFLFLQCLNF